MCVRAHAHVCVCTCACVCVCACVHVCACVRVSASRHMHMTSPQQLRQVSDSRQHTTQCRQTYCPALVRRTQTYAQNSHLLSGGANGNKKGLATNHPPTLLSLPPPTGNSINHTLKQYYGPLNGLAKCPFD